MTQIDSTNQASKDTLIGRSYLCCSGPHKGESITVTGRAAPRENEKGARYSLESERGATWTISGEKLRRIFGPSSKRTCKCHPIDSGLEDAVPEMVEPAAEEATEERPEIAPSPEAVEAASASTEDLTAEPVQPEAAQVIFEESCAQGMLFR